MKRRRISLVLTGIAAIAAAGLLELPRETELAIREKDGRQYIFVLNYRHEPVQICLKQPMRDMYAGAETEGTIELKAYETKVFLKK